MIFIDTNFIIAYSLKQDKYHGRALEIWKDIENIKKIISRTIIVETFNILNTKRKENIELQNKVCNFILDELIILNDHTHYRRAFDIMNRLYSDRVQFADCIYMALMEDYGIGKIATFDKHFNNINGIERIH